MKRTYKALMVLIVLLVAVGWVVPVQAADVQVKTSGPSGQGDLIYWCPVTAVTNMVMGSNGVEVLNVEGAVAIVGDVSLTGTLTADTITASATNITAGTVLNAVSGINVTNLNGANISTGNIAEERISNALVNATTVGDAGTVLAGVGTAITAINAANITAGTTASAFNGAAVTNLNGENISSGNIGIDRMTNAFPTGTTYTFTNVMYNGGASSSDWVFVNGRLINP